MPTWAKVLVGVAIAYVAWASVVWGPLAQFWWLHAGFTGRLTNERLGSRDHYMWQQRGLARDHDLVR